MLHIFVYAHTCLYTYFHIYLHAYSSLHFYIHTTYTIPAQCIHNPIPYHTTNTIPYIQTNIHTHTYTLTIYIYIYLFIYLFIYFFMYICIYIYTHNNVDPLVCVSFSDTAPEAGTGSRKSKTSALPT